MAIFVLAVPGTDQGGELENKTLRIRKTYSKTVNNRPGGLITSPGVGFCGPGTGFCGPGCGLVVINVVASHYVH